MKNRDRDGDENDRHQRVSERVIILVSALSSVWSAVIRSNHTIIFIRGYFLRWRRVAAREGRA